ncbi:hypothetical protein NEOLEDRAFT_1139687 [Neolentinus lepideus HHB14362 ss-1]|uniref:Uncharacterized protein n=1 Tax=Neolentinus lepideus HHB14362 ss-1 TaxID=1314782 RepID=A0A165PQ43_9AGAM|nr:hypothetical protein NEOLEDRAFT_1139687 [Neolentinus lepideus HHB14362 ss-1]
MDENSDFISAVTVTRVTGFVLSDPPFQARLVFDNSRASSVLFTYLFQDGNAFVSSWSDRDCCRRLAAGVEFR